MQETVSKLGRKGNPSNLKKKNLKTATNIIHHSETSYGKCFQNVSCSRKIQNRTRMPAVLSFIPHCMKTCCRGCSAAESLQSCPTLCYKDNKEKRSESSFSLELFISLYFKDKAVREETKEAWAQSLRKLYKGSLLEVQETAKLKD